MRRMALLASRLVSAMSLLLTRRSFTKTQALFAVAVASISGFVICTTVSPVASAMVTV